MGAPAPTPPPLSLAPATGSNIETLDLERRVHVLIDSLATFRERTQQFTIRLNALLDQDQEGDSPFIAQVDRLGGGSLATFGERTQQLTSRWNALLDQDQEGDRRFIAQVDRLCGGPDLSESPTEEWPLCGGPDLSESPTEVY